MKNWRLGAPVVVALNSGGRLGGQVWAMAREGFVWLAMDNRAFLAANTSTLDVSSEPGGDAVGKVA